MNDNAPPPPPLGPGYVPIVGVVVGDGRVLITDPAWRPAPRPAAGDDARA